MVGISCSQRVALKSGIPGWQESFTLGCNFSCWPALRGISHVSDSPASMILLGQETVYVCSTALHFMSGCCICPVTGCEAFGGKHTCTHAPSTTYALSHSFLLMLRFVMPALTCGAYKSHQPASLIEHMVDGRLLLHAKGQTSTKLWAAHDTVLLIWAVRPCCCV